MPMSFTGNLKSRKYNENYLSPRVVSVYLKLLNFFYFMQ